MAVASNGYPRGYSKGIKRGGSVRPVQVMREEDMVEKTSSPFIDSAVMSGLARARNLDPGGAVCGRHGLLGAGGRNQSDGFCLRGRCLPLRVRDWALPDRDCADPSLRRQTKPCFDFSWPGTSRMTLRMCAICARAMCPLSQHGYIWRQHSSSGQQCGRVGAEGVRRTGNGPGSWRPRRGRVPGRPTRPLFPRLPAQAHHRAASRPKRKS